jgi:hypothetical protein
MVYGVLLLLDALGTQVSGNELESKVLNFDKVDQKIKKIQKDLDLSLEDMDEIFISYSILQKLSCASNRVHTRNS